MIEVEGPQPGSRMRLVLDWLRAQSEPVSMAQVAEGLRDQKVEGSIKFLLSRLVESGYVQRQMNSQRVFFVATDLDPDAPQTKDRDAWNDEEHQQFMAYWGQRYFERQRRKNHEFSLSNF